MYICMKLGGAGGMPSPRELNIEFLVYIMYVYNNIYIIMYLYNVAFEAILYRSFKADYDAQVGRSL